MVGDRADVRVQEGLAREEGLEDHLLGRSALSNRDLPGARLVATQDGVEEIPVLVHDLVRPG